MPLREKLIILCAPLTVLIEWVAVAFIAIQIPLDVNEPLSAIPYYQPSYSLFFSLVVATVAITFTTFTLALKPYWKEAFRFGVICGILMVVAAFTVYSPYGGLGSDIHSGTANLATLGYTFILFQVSFRSHGLMRRAGMIFTGIAAINIVGVLLSINVFHAYGTWFQLLLALTVQAWALYVTYFLWNNKAPTTPSLD